MQEKTPLSSTSSTARQFRAKKATSLVEYGYTQSQSMQLTRWYKKEIFLSYHNQLQPHLSPEVIFKIAMLRGGQKRLDFLVEQQKSQDLSDILSIENLATILSHSEGLVNFEKVNLRNPQIKNHRLTAEHLIKFLTFRQGSTYLLEFLELDLGHPAFTALDLSVDTLVTILVSDGGKEKLASLLALDLDSERIKAWLPKKQYFLSVLNRPQGEKNLNALLDFDFQSPKVLAWGGLSANEAIKLASHIYGYKNLKIFLQYEPSDFKDFQLDKTQLINLISHHYGYLNAETLLKFDLHQRVMQELKLSPTDLVNVASHLGGARNLTCLANLSKDYLDSLGVERQMVVDLLNCNHGYKKINNFLAELAAQKSSEQKTSGQNKFLLSPEEKHQLSRHNGGEKICKYIENISTDDERLKELDLNLTDLFEVAKCSGGISNLNALFTVKKEELEQWGIEKEALKQIIGHIGGAKCLESLRRAYSTGFIANSVFEMNQVIRILSRPGSSTTFNFVVEKAAALKLQKSDTNRIIALIAKHSRKVREYLDRCITSQESFANWDKQHASEMTPKQETPFTRQASIKRRAENEGQSARSKKRQKRTEQDSLPTTIDCSTEKSSEEASINPELTTAPSDAQAPSPNNDNSITMADLSDEDLTGIDLEEAIIPPELTAAPTYSQILPPNGSITMTDQPGEDLTESRLEEAIIPLELTTGPSYSQTPPPNGSNITMTDQPDEDFNVFIESVMNNNWTLADIPELNPQSESFVDLLITNDWVPPPYPNTFFKAAPQPPSSAKSGESETELHEFDMEGFEAPYTR
ncbi:Avirulence protein AvrBs3 [Legionella nautarum]|uniref:Avirulence protein AvrBs3 n=1 Tax=Legionella nautarum TaxID=45070 RepID=A0A0W0WZE6_9GAMM|nr:hypothetical protein [Legionella nautarum]KTD37687.1 Avirulence protein AvrBs3 [Legionella nautarum]